jgi:ribosomal protein S18 acetylase RimI-like enzyme
MTFSAFSTPTIELGHPPVGAARLVTLAPGSGARLAQAIVAMPPWSVMAYPAETLASFLERKGDGACRYLIEIGGVEAGAVSVRYPWLKGPYLELLALLPDCQSQGLGSAILAWFEREAKAHDARNLWVCASSFNVRALRFYQRHGFQPAATLPGLVADGYDELLLRKFPL